MLLLYAFLCMTFQVDDLSLRDNSTHCLTIILSQFTRLGHDQGVFQELISQGLLVQVKSGLKSRSEVRITCFQ